MAVIDGVVSNDDETALLNNDTIRCYLSIWLGEMEEQSMTSCRRRLLGLHNFDSKERTSNGRVKY